MPSIFLSNKADGPGSLMKNSSSSFSNFLFSDSFDVLTIFRELEGGGKIFLSNVLIHVLELLGKEVINVPLSYTF